MLANSIEYKTISKIQGPLVFVEGIGRVGLGELAEIKQNNGDIILAEVLDISEDLAVLQVLANPQGLSTSSCRVRFTGAALCLPVSLDMIGRTFDGLGRPRDGLPGVVTSEHRELHDAAINPECREYPRNFLQTGISTIDLMNSLVRGQKLPIFSGSGLAHDRLAAQIARQATVAQARSEFIIIFAAMGVKHDVARFFLKSFEESGVTNHVTMFLSLADDPSVERLITPRAALTFAEYCAFEQGMHVLVILTDMTNYCEALREISTARAEIPSRKGYPGYMYSDLASIYERAGRVQGRNGSLTQLPILTMPNDDISHPIPDLTGYITEGQIVLERELFQKGIYPGIAVLPSLSRLMKDGVGAEKTRSDHAHLAAQLFAAYSKVKKIRALAQVIGDAELSIIDRTYLEFGNEFEQRLVTQGEYENRDINFSLDIGWSLLKLLPRSELLRVTEAELNNYYNA